jgi:hypothetical protein
MAFMASSAFLRAAATEPFEVGAQVGIDAQPNRFRTKSANEVYQNRRDACVKSDGIGPELLPDAQQDDIAAAP